MAGLIELNTFVGKFVRLWQSGSDASLKVESKARKASLILQLDLGYQHNAPQRQQVSSPVVRAARVRHCQRRAAERQAAAEAANEHQPAEVEAEQAEAEQQTVQECADAEQAKQANQATLAAEASVGVNTSTAEKAVKDFLCDFCDKTFETLKGLRTHTGRLHKETSSPIPQIDGCNDANEPTYCKVCRKCPNEIETSEDVNYHVMNNHDKKEVLEVYGQEWARTRKYCIRRFSPFENYF